MKFDHVLELKITLEGVKPPIWRRIQVPCTYSFWDLHVAIQDAMGWNDSHLHLFTVPIPLSDERVAIGIPDDDMVMARRELPGWEIPVAGFLTLLYRKAEYLYDFGDSWEHRVVLERILPRPKGEQYPKCTGGRRACPPDDSGGVFGYLRMLEVLTDPTDEEYEETLAWLGGNFDPEHFDSKSVRFDDPDERWEIAFGEG